MSNWDVEKWQAAKDARRNWYAQQLKDPRWLDMREYIIARDSRECQSCQTLDNLEVHHRYYLPGCKPWEYESDALVTLCHECHADETHYSEVMDYHRKKMAYLRENPGSMFPHPKALDEWAAQAESRGCRI